MRDISSFKLRNDRKIRCLLSNSWHARASQKIYFSREFELRQKHPLNSQIVSTKFFFLSNIFLWAQKILILLRSLLKGLFFKKDAFQIYVRKQPPFRGFIFNKGCVVNYLQWPLSKPFFFQPLLSSF